MQKSIIQQRCGWIGEMKMDVPVHATIELTDECN